MKQATNSSKNSMNKKASQKQFATNRKAEANAHHKVNKKWELIENTPRYRSALAKEVCETITKKIEIEVLNGILLNLLKTVDIRSPKTVISVHFSSSKPMAMQIY